jgi:hypothetical protein
MELGFESRASHLQSWYSTTQSDVQPTFGLFNPIKYLHVDELKSKP